MKSTTKVILIGNLVQYSIYRNNINKTIIKRTELYINKGEN
jgi:hypothetical protein